MSAATPPFAPIRRGLWFEDYSVGQIYVSGARTLTEADIVAFAGLSGDYNPLHVDETFARRSPFRGRIAHGVLMIAVATGLAAQMGIFDGTVQAFSEVGARFLEPVRADDTVHLRLDVVEVDPAPTRRRGNVRFATVMLNQDSERVAEGHWTMLFLRRKPAGTAEEAV